MWAPPCDQREFRKPEATYLLAPMIDSLNHRTEVPTDLEFDSMGQNLKLKLAKAYKTGEQVSGTRRSSGGVDSPC